MIIIPVVDLLQGIVVHARRGQRSDYAPLRSCLTSACSPVEVVDALLALHAFPILYAADLDAIEGKGENADALRAIGRRHPRLELWLDAGSRTLEACSEWGLGVPVRPVLGSESMTDVRLLERLTHDRYGGAPVLSLDFRAGVLQGPSALLDDPSRWPRDVLVMHLDHVGAGAGPDFERIDWLRRLAPGHRVYAAGGVRGGGDLISLAERGAHGALVATALHDGSLDTLTLLRWRYSHDSLIKKNAPG